MSHLLFGPVQPSPVLWYKVNLHKCQQKLDFSLFSAVSIQWNGLLESTTGMPFDLKFSHKNPIGVWDSVITLLSS